MDGRTKKVLFHAWMNGWNKRRIDNNILSSNNTTDDSFFKPYLITLGKSDTKKEDELSQTKRKYSNTSKSIDEQPNKRMCKAEKLEAIQYSLGPNKEYIAITKAAFEAKTKIFCRIYYSNNQNAVSIMKDTVYPCCITKPQKKPVQYVVSVKTIRFLNAASIIVVKSELMLLSCVSTGQDFREKAEVYTIVSTQLVMIVLQNIKLPAPIRDVDKTLIASKVSLRTRQQEQGKLMKDVPVKHLLQSGRCHVWFGGYEWSIRQRKDYYALMAYSSLVPPPYTGNFMPPTPDLSFTGLDEFVNKPVVENRKFDEEVSKVVRKSDDSPIIEDWVSDNEKENVSQTKTEKKIVKPSIAKIEHMKGNMSYPTDYEEINGGYAAFGGNPKGGKITGKCTIKTGNVEEPLSKRVLMDDGSKLQVMMKRLMTIQGKDWECNDQEKEDNVNSTNTVNVAGTNEVDINNLDTTIQVSPIPTTRIHKDHTLDQVIGDLYISFTIKKLSKIWRTKTVKKDEKGNYDTEIRRLVAKGNTRSTGLNMIKSLPVARIEAIRKGVEVKTASTPIETQKPLLKDENDEEVDVQYVLDTKSSKPRLICKKQTVVTNSTTEAEYVAASKSTT
ncbi:hypothetical protein Tco_1030610 [Tanacetum coccineum]|uniref:Uncharacterized protein n=1 Tax=Tanacetum coccineum TaxID=301880 RepID=A0ABQ5G7F5_9ASTR